MRPKHARFTDEEIINIRNLWRNGASYNMIAKELGLDPKRKKTHIQRIVIGELYADVPGAATADERRERYGAQGPRPVWRGGAW